MVEYKVPAIEGLRLEALYGEAYNILILGNQANIHQAWIIAYVVEYEAIKAHYKIRLEQ